MGSFQTSRFRDREDAGRRLAEELRPLAAEHPVVVALPRGGVPVGYEIARALHAPLDICVVRKIGVPWHEELGAGAVAEGGFVHISREIVEHVGLKAEALAQVTEAKKREVQERVRKFRGKRQRIALRDRTVIVVDDGIATGGTVFAALLALRAEQPKSLVLAVPVAAPETLRALEPKVDRVVALLVPADLYAIGLWYEDFEQVSDEQVVELLARAAHAAGEEAAQ